MKESPLSPNTEIQHSSQKTIPPRPKRDEKFKALLQACLHPRSVNEAAQISGIPRSSAQPPSQRAVPNGICKNLIKSFRTTTAGKDWIQFQGA